MGSDSISGNVKTVALPLTEGAIEVSVVMPCLNESRTVAACIRQALEALDRAGIRGEVVVGDNGSTDGSREISLNAGARVVPVRRRGYGAAVRQAVSAARGHFVVMGDSDGSYDFTQVSALIEKLREGFDLVIGNRFEGRIEPGAMPPLNRYIGNPLLTWLGRILFKSPVGDFHCGLRAFRKAAITRLNLKTEGMEFASEMIVKATLFGLRIAEVPTTLAPEAPARASHLRPLRDGWRHLCFLLLYSPRWLFLYPGIALMLLGVLLGGWLLPGPRTVRGVTLDIHTLLFAAMAILVGFQSINFAAFTKIFGITEGLLPEDPRLNRVFRYVTLETGIAVGALLVLSGVAMWAVGLTDWSDAHFGPLDPAKMLRIVIPGIVSLTLGFQVILSSFFLSVLGMARK
jgi:glycosyltransferase involved in cell wall biosynthesis